MLDQLETHARRVAPAVDHWAVRGLHEKSEQLQVRQDIAEAPLRSRDAGAMVTVVHRGGIGYAATPRLDEAGLAAAFDEARRLAEASAGRCVTDYSALPRPAAQGRHASPVQRPLDASTLAERLELLQQACASMAVDARIIDRSASLWSVQAEQLFVDSAGSRIEQRFSFIIPNLQATAHARGVTQVRSAAGQYNGFCQQGGLEVLERARFREDGPRVAREALELVAAPPCPSGEMDLLLMPDQMMLQIHESIGHPLELDRILGDERNFAGTSFVTLDMFGHYRWGSELLNVSHDPTRAEEFASFAFDDDGMPATREMLIERGVLMRPLGGAVSLARAREQRPDLQGVATARAAGWNRAPIDRMGNLNVEPGDSTLEEMIAAVEHGVLMRTNCSWSIDDSRNKFQFGCEHGQVIRHGRLAEVVRTPGYRGISATFWRSLAMVGDASTLEVMGTPFCGKGEPSQVIRVGHASPACLFRNVAVFGGEA
ncbi:TldD/PmbA family protein [Caldimonas tepidiphila]|uniref:TldD/PmbA family protein n=1 Tax=Caldimonas tepidiphila TaxID=2315841 RepID=UPI000E5A90EA|nr:TldD/PmbA family protein [Caldimonas tepidiphila]